MHVSVNFGQQPFVFDIDGMVKVCSFKRLVKASLLIFSLQKEKLGIHAEISATSIANLHPPLDETALIQELVAQFLAHDGYVETARAFAEEVRQESAALQNGRAQPLKQYEAEDDVDATNRQSRIACARRV